ncbi:MAG: hypothetical protein NZT92_04650, partial [Abditibacteriales bacterium]|nr:hypothetical protein [Abditibacteriales bacterium]MDW8365230.1 hypothetical protein [Abditibacteriales bacterium]
MEFVLAVIGLGIVLVIALSFGIALTWAVVMLTMRMLGFVTRRERTPYRTQRQRQRSHAPVQFIEPNPVLGDNLFSRIGAFSIRAIAVFILLVFLTPLLMPLLMMLSSLCELGFTLIVSTFPWTLLLLILIGHRIYLGLHRYYRHRVARGSQPFWFFQRGWTYPSLP